MNANTLLLTTSLALLASASPQGPPNGGNWGAGGPFAAFPSCASSCRPSNLDYSNPSSLCSNTATLNSLNSCVDSSSCSATDRDNIREAIAQLCVNAGASVTVAPYNTWSVTSGESAQHTGAWTGSGEWSSWTSGWQTAASDWSSFTSAHPLPTAASDLSSWASANGFPGGSAWPTAWTTNSAWASAVSAWSSGGPGGPAGWHGGPGGPFGQGWGPWSSGAWESGPWTAWWGTNACPPSTWSGWTAGTWSNNAPWTTWTACSATATASRVIAITTTNAAGSQITSQSTSFGYQLADVTNGGASSTTSGSGAMPTNFAVIGSGVGAMGVLAGAVLL